MTATVPSNEFGFTYAMMHSRQFNLRILDIQRNVTPDMSEQTQDVPGMTGNLYQGMDVQSRPFVITVWLIADSHEQRNDLIHSIAEWLAPVEDGEFPLVFDDEPNTTYYAHVSSVSAITRALYQGTASITFTCSDPRGFLPQETVQPDSTPYTFTPDGSDKTAPILTCIPNKDVTRIGVADPDKNYVYLGNVSDPDMYTIVDNEPRILHELCNDMSLWTPVTAPSWGLEHHTVISGTMQSQGDALKVAQVSGKDDYGSLSSSNFHGPCVKRMFPSSCPDWRIRVRLYNTCKYPRAAGKSELYLLDPNGKRIGVVQIKDQSSSEDMIAYVSIGGDLAPWHTICYTSGKIEKKGTRTDVLKYKATVRVRSRGRWITQTVWRTITDRTALLQDTYTNFYGYIELSKIGNKYHVEIMKMKDSTECAWDTPITFDFTDTSGEYTSAPLAGMAFFCGKMDITEDTLNPPTSYTNNALGLTDVLVWNILNGGNTASDVAPIARAGDEIKINCESHQVFKNGAPLMSQLAAGSDFIRFQGGVPSTLAFEPSLDDAQWFIDYVPTRG